MLHQATGFSKKLEQSLFWVNERVFPTVVDWRTNAPKDGMLAEGTYSMEAVRALDTHRTPIQKQPEMLMCVVGISHRYYLGDEVYPTFLHDNDRDMDLFNLIHAPNPIKVKVGSRPRAPHEVPLLTLTANRVIQMDDPAVVTDSSGVPSTMEKSPLDFALEAGASDQGATAPEMSPSEDVSVTAAPGTGQAEEVAAVDPSAAAESRKRGRDGIDVNAPPKSLQRDYVDPRPPGSSHGGKSLAAIQLGLAATASVPDDAPTGVNDSDPLSFADPPARLPADVAMGSQLRLRFEQEAKLLRKSVAQVATLQQQVSGEEKPKAAFKEFKRQQDERVKQRCAEMDARLDALSIDFNEELYPHMLTAIAGRRWIAKGLSEGLRHGLEHGQAQRSLKSIEAYDPEAEAKFVAALEALKDLRYPLVDQLESLKDAPMDVIMAALYLESDTGDDAPRNICDLHPSSSQLTIPVYPEVRDPRNPWACKEEIVLADAIAANINRAEKKKKCRIVCRTHGVGSAHHARSDGVPVSVSMVVPQGLALLLEDAATQTEFDT
nr:transposase (putative), gypsy type [Tanacetum cinerariifolium]